MTLCLFYDDAARRGTSFPHCVDEETGAPEVQVVTLYNLLFLLVEILVIFPPSLMLCSLAWGLH